MPLYGFEQPLRLGRWPQPALFHIEQFQVGTGLHLRQHPAHRRLRGVQHDGGGRCGAAQHHGAEDLDFTKSWRARHMDGLRWGHRVYISSV
jgi:hypothetical protein